VDVSIHEEVKLGAMRCDTMWEPLHCTVLHIPLSSEDSWSHKSALLSMLLDGQSSPISSLTMHTLLSPLPFLNLRRVVDACAMMLPPMGLFVSLAKLIPVCEWRGRG
jgi:hypothetical protein